METDLVSIGLTTLDIVARPIEALTRTERATLIEGIAMAPAGTAGGAAVVAGRLGLSVKIVGAVGDDPAGEAVRRGFEREGVDVSLLATRPGEPTSTTLLAVEPGGRRSSWHMPGAGGKAEIGPVVGEAARNTRFLHYAAVGGLLTDKGPGMALLQEAKAAGAVVTCDLIGPRRSAPDELKRLLPFVDWFIPSAAEAEFLTGLADLTAAAEEFRAWGAKACVIKNGRAGCWASIGSERFALPAFAVQPLDTTSCGDAFCAGFIAALLRGRAPKDALRFASMTAGLVAEGLATLGRLEGFEAADAAMARVAIAD
jgi:sugar/nucleoside kinase (ribokinase family)